MNFFETLLNPDRDEFPNRTIVVNAANLLQVGEFQLLQLAFADWFGREMTEREQSHYFQAFVLGNEIPPFLRHYARRIVEREARGQLNDADARYHRYDNEYFRQRLPDGMRRFVVAVTIVVGVLGGSLAMASYTVDINGRCSDTLPPCVTAQELDGQRDR